LTKVDPGSARVVPASYVGGPGSEIYVPVAEAPALYDRLWAAGKDLGLRDCGYYALDALRIEAGRRAWGAELGPDENPFEAGLMFAVKLDKSQPFIGRAALLAARDQPLRRKLLTFVFDDAAAYAWGGEAIVVDGQTVGELSSVGWSPKAGACVGLGYVRSAAAQTVHVGTPVLIDLWGEPKAARAWDRWPGA
jgi:4-methylaminobutanoate oxidase (formaldehyde-forming)